MKTNEMHYFSNLFDKVLYMFRTGPVMIALLISVIAVKCRLINLNLVTQELLKSSRVCVRLLLFFLPSDLTGYMQFFGECRKLGCDTP